MMDRFGWMALLRAHWYGLSDRNADGTVTPNWPARITSVGVPAVLGLIMVLTTTRLDNDAAGAVTVAAGIVAGALLSLFGPLAAWRERLTDRADVFPTEDQPKRDMIDESVGHLLQGTRESVIIALLAATMYIAETLPQWLSISLSALIIAFAAHVVVIFFVLTNQLYAGYISRNRVRSRLDGSDATLRPVARGDQQTLGTALTKRDSRRVRT